MIKYHYSNPVDRGFTKFKLTKRQHNKLLKYRQMNWHDKYEYYYNDKEIIFHRLDNWKVIILTTLLFPVIVLLHGLVNFKEAWRDLKRLYKQKQSGSFVGDSVSNSSEKYDEIMEIIKRK